MSNFCCAMMYPRGSYRGVHCGNTAKIERDGLFYCGTHDPVAIEAKRAERDKEYSARHDKQQAEAKAKAAALAEQKRRADCLMDLIEAAETVLTNEEHAFSGGMRNYQVGSQTWQVYEDLRLMVAKATGVKP